MIGVKERLHTLLILSSEYNTPYFRDAYRNFNNVGYAVFLVNILDDAITSINNHRIDVIILDAEHVHCENLLSTANTITNTRPITCVLTNESETREYAGPIDILLPFIPIQFLEREIQTHINYRQQINHHQLEVDEINLLKNAIVRNVSHELKTPLLQVKSAVALIVEDAEDDRLSQMAIKATARLENIVKNITLLADSMNGHFGPTILAEGVEHAIRSLRRSWVHKDEISRVQLIEEENIPPVMADKQGISVVMQQLIDNALKFSTNPVYIRLSRCDTGVRVAVQDTGIGIAENKVQQIFDSFYQVDSSATRRYGGTGVGLAIVRLILEKHGAIIEVNSKLGEGSTFSFVLPEADF